MTILGYKSLYTPLRVCNYKPSLIQPPL